MYEYGSNPFSGIRFLLSGFEPSHHQQVKSDLVSVGGVYVPKYGPDSTLIVVHNLLFDDPICVTARKDGKTVVTSLWVDHSLDAGEPADVTSIMFRPPKDMNGIPGAEELVMCLTGYQRQHREDITTMVGLMGAQFSKPLVANKVTHLICYKFEGEKYELAKKFKQIKLVNQQWLKDCLKAWKILPQEGYVKCDYELEMEAEAQDSDEEAGDITWRPIERSNINTIPSLQQEMGGAQPFSGLSNTMSSPSKRQGLPIATNAFTKFPIKEEMKAGEQSKYGNLDQMDQLSPKCYRTQGLMGVDDIVSDKNVSLLSSNLVGIGLPSTSRNAKVSVNSEAEKFSSLSGSSKTPARKSTLPLHVGDIPGNLSGDSSNRLADSDTAKSSPLGSRKSPRRSSLSLQSAGNLSNCGLEPGKETGASVCQRTPNSRKVTDSDTDKVSPLNSRKTPKRSSPSLQTAGKLGNSDGKAKKISSENVDDVCMFNSQPENGQASPVWGVPKTGTIALDKDGPGKFLPQKRNMDDLSDVFHVTPKSLKLATSAGKKTDAAQSSTPASSPLMKSKIVNPNISSQMGDETAKSSKEMSVSKVSSVKSKAKSVAPSKTLSSKMLQVNSMNTREKTTPNYSSVTMCTTPRNNDKEVWVQNQRKAFSSPVIKDLEVDKPAGSNLNVDDQTGNSTLKPARKKSVARKTLGSRPKLNKRSADAKKGSPFGNSLGGDGALSIGQLDENRANSSSADKCMKDASTRDTPVEVGSKPFLNSVNEIDDTMGSLNDETKLPPELDVQNQKSVATELVKYQTDEPGIVNIPSRKYVQAVSPARCDKEKQKVIQKKGPGKTTNTVLAAMEKPNDRDEAEGEKTYHRPLVENKHVLCVSGRKRRGTLLLNKSDELVEQEEQPNATVCKDQGLSKVEKHTVRKRHGTLLLNKSDDPVELGREDEPGLGGDELKINDKKHTGKLVTKSNLTSRTVETERENDPVVSIDPVTSKGGKKAGKLVDKKRRGTLLLNKSEGPVEVEKENEPDAVGELKINDEKYTRKLAAKSNLTPELVEAENQNEPVVRNDRTGKGGKLVGKLVGKKRRGTLILNKSDKVDEVGKENEQVLDDVEGNNSGEKQNEKLASKSNQIVSKSNEMDANRTPLKTLVDFHAVKHEPAWFLVSGHKLQRKEFQQLIKRLRGRLCRDSHQWSYQATHFIVPGPLRRTEKFFAAAASGRWILKTDYLTASSQAGKFLPEEPYEWHKTGLSEDGAINLEAPRKWRVLREKTGHGAFYGMRIVIYGECIAPPLDTLKRVVKAGDGSILATSPPYSRFLKSGVDFAIVSPGMPRVDIWVQEFLRHEIPCVSADYLVEYVCKPGYSLERHVQYNTHEWAAKSFSKLLSLSEQCVDNAKSDTEVQDCADLACQVCGCTDRGEVMLVCGSEDGSTGCGTGSHIDCCDPPLQDVPEEDWFCSKCTESPNNPSRSTKKKPTSKSRS